MALLPYQIYLQNTADSESLSVPETVSNTIYWLDASFVTHSGDGTEVTAATDQGQGSANTIIKATAGGPIYRTTAFNGGPCLEIGANKGLYSTGAGAPVASFLNGTAAASKELTVITVWQPRQNLTTFPWTFTKSNATTRGVICQCNSHAYKPQVFGGTTGGAQATLNAPVYWDHPIPAIYTFRRAGSSTPVMKIRQDGIDQADVTWTWTGNHDTDSFGVGVRHGASPAFGNLAWIRDVIVFNRALTDVEVAEWEAYLGQERGFKHKLAPSSAGDWLIVWLRGQSNQVGFGSVSQTTYPLVPDANAFYMALDGFVKQIVMDTGDGVNASSVNIVWNSPTYAAMTESIRAQLRARGETRKLLFVIDALGSTPTSSWVNGLLSNPPTINTLCGYAKHRVRDALKAPGASLVCFTDQGESNGSSLQETVDWRIDWNASCDEHNAYFSAYWDKDIHYVFGRLAETFPIPIPFAAELRVEEDAFNTERDDVIMVQNPNGTDSPGHRNGAEQLAAGILYANAWSDV